MTLLARCFLVLVAVVIGISSFSLGKEPKVMTYHGIRATDPGGRSGLRNPERGWRTESIIAAKTDGVFYGPAQHVKRLLPPVYEEDFWIADAEKYESFGLTIVQSYCYLTKYRDRLIPEDKLQSLRNSLQHMRDRGFKALLRFAYETDMSDPARAGATREQILHHIDQLEPIVREYADVIYVLQAGFIGAWGEWHSAEFITMEDIESRAMILKRILQMLPEDRMTQLRVPLYKSTILKSPIFDDFFLVDAENAFSLKPATRIGFNNDGFLATNTDGGTWPVEPFGVRGNPDFDYITDESPFLAVDGELFWSDMCYDGIGPRGAGGDGLLAAVRFRLHHYTTFSIAHSHSLREGNNLSIDYWQSTPITEEQLRNEKMPISDGWFCDAFGNPVVRSQFEYITDHLGYRLELQGATFSDKVKSDETFDIAINLINRGFSAPINPRPIFITLIDADGNVTPLKTTANPRTWQPYQPNDANHTPLVHRIEGEWRLPEEIKPGHYKVGLYMPDPYEKIGADSRFAIRVANRNSMWWTQQNATSRDSYGINVLGSIEVVP
ncbi:MAG: DUF4874 domain-containing protein [Thermoguttaceae bacterium]